MGSTADLDLAWFPERPSEPEVDYAITSGEHRIPMEVKYRRNIDDKDTRGLVAFMSKKVYNAPFGIMITLSDDITTNHPDIVCVPLSTLLIMR